MQCHMFMMLLLMLEQSLLALLLLLLLLPLRSDSPAKRLVQVEAFSSGQHNTQDRLDADAYNQRQCQYHQPNDIVTIHTTNFTIHTTTSIVYHNTHDHHREHDGDTTNNFGERGVGWVWLGCGAGGKPACIRAKYGVTFWTFLKTFKILQTDMSGKGLVATYVSCGYAHGVYHMEPNTECFNVAYCGCLACVDPMHITSVSLGPSHTGHLKLGSSKMYTPFLPKDLIGPWRVFTGLGWMRWVRQAPTASCNKCIRACLNSE